jgi:transposase
MIPAGARVWIAMGHTDMRRGMQSWQQWCSRLLETIAGDLWVFRGRSGALVKIIWHDNLGCRYIRSDWNEEVHLARREGRRGVA